MLEDECLQLRVNKDYARKYDERKRGEELSKLKEKYGDLAHNEESDSTSEEEDEYGELVTPEIDAQILKTITAIRSKDPKVYDSNTSFFADGEIEEARNLWEENRQRKKTEAKPMKITDYQRELLLKSGGVIDDDENTKMHERVKLLTYAEEEEQLKAEFKAAVENCGIEADEGDLLVQRQRTAEEIAAEEDEYKKFLLESVAQSTNSTEILEQWQSVKTNPTISSDEKFLMEYILSRGWIDKDANRIPTYKELTADHRDDEDEEFDAKVDEFESKYNFRFEEEGGSQILTHSRNVEGSVRRKDNKRQLQRQSRTQRKSEEKLKREEELKRLKNLKKKEIYEKLHKIKEITGNENVGFDEVDLEEDFDPEKYDAKMNEVFNEEYYSAKDSKNKPTKQEKKKFEEYLDEYYQLDYDDIIGDTPVRFRYCQTNPSNFGLTPEEILLADDQDLNEYVSLKKYAPYRPDHVVEADIRKYSKKKRLREFRKKLRQQYAKR
ncbi:2876_t:CDS:2 [Paraglomus brasilianum]|uniref:2876_t:CDS:1 n=1 Tax=Paraglomus brasilianum TaxID=144538 RepID=A0A9N9B0I0_9GLOM|nr:2876_t:CDS:2 [Paraglomus brasilianum]